MDSQTPVPHPTSIAERGPIISTTRGTICLADLREGSRISAKNRLAYVFIGFALNDPHPFPTTAGRVIRGGQRLPGNRNSLGFISRPFASPSILSYYFWQDTNQRTIDRMSFLRMFQKIDRSRWYVCHTCLGNTSHCAEKSIFYMEAAPVNVMGRLVMPCPRCNDTNTRSFQQMKEEGSDAALWGLERIVKKNPRDMFEVGSANTLRAAS
jgi:hypothetical protein